MFSDYLRMAINSIRSRRLRSLVTLLGVIIGVAGVITSVSIAEGIKQQVAAETSNLAGDVLTIRPGTQLSRDSSGIIGGINFLSPNTTSSPLSEKDLATIRDTEGVRLSVPLSSLPGLSSKDDKSYNEAIIIGTTPGLFNLLDIEVEFGNFFDKDSGEKFAVIGPAVAKNLFQENVPVGQSFKVRGHEFIVNGVLERQQTASFSQGVDFNKVVIIPYSTAKQMNKGALESYEILAQVNHAKDLDKVAAQIEKQLSAGRGGQKDFSILRASDTRKVSDKVIDLISSMIIVIAVISMLVGGVGIMNVMLVSVSERTREIGIRKAVGATNSQIASQFIIEAAVLSLWGALLGIFAAALINAGLRIFTGIQPAIVWEVILFAGVLAVIIGVVFGVAPALKAARRNPIDALRSDS